MNVFRSAISNDQGEVDAGYLAMAVLMVIVTGAIPAMCIGTFVAMWFDPAHKFAVQDLGIGIGAVCGGFATAIGAVGVFRMGDRSHSTVIADRRAGAPLEATK